MKNGPDPRGICPRCGERRMNPKKSRNALSRKDETTHVCSSCGVDEAMRNLMGKELWPGYPGVMVKEGSS